MTWLQPWAVWFLAGAPVIVLLYFLRLRRRPVTVSTLIFWQRVTREATSRALFQRLRNLFSLLLQLLIFLLLVGALARPLFDRAVPEGTSTVLVLDARARMQAVEPGGATRFEKARQLARDHARHADGLREFALLTLDAKPSVAVPFTGDEKPLRETIDSIAPTDAGGDLSVAIDLAESLLAARKGSGRIIVLTDRALRDEKERAFPVVTHAVGTSLDNLAVTRFATRPLPSSPGTSEIFLEVCNFGRAAARTDVELALDGRPLEVKPLALAAGERRTEIFTSVPSPGRSARGWLTARLTADDPHPSDNVAFATLPPVRAIRVLLVSNGSPFLEKLLGVDPGVKFEFVAPEGYQPAMAGKFEVVIFDGKLPDAFDLNASTGNFLFLKATPFAAEGAALDQPLITDVDSTHPATRLVSLQNVNILQAQRLVLPPSQQGWTYSAPLRSFEHPLLLTGERGGQRVAALAFDLLQSDLPLRVAFPLLIDGTLHWLAGERLDALPALRDGESLALPPGRSVAVAPLKTPPPSGETAAAPSITGLFEPLRNGFYRVDDNGATRWLVVNTFSAAESDLRVPGESEMPAPAVAAPTIGFRVLPPWHWLAIGAFILSAVEWWLFHRRKTE